MPSKPAGTLYRGREGMWSWVAHRITGVGIFFFLLVHVLDTALVRVSPHAYNEVIGTYKNPIVGLLEVGLVAAILFHAFNGIRLILIDFWAKGPRYQRQLMIGRRCDLGGAVRAVRDPSPLPRLRRLRCSEIAAPRSSSRSRSLKGGGRNRSGQTNFELYSWLFMRLSGLALVILVLGHLLS